MLQFGQDFIRCASCGGVAGFRQNALAGLLDCIPVLRLMSCRRLESAEVVNIRSSLISDEIIFRSRLPDVFKEELNLAAVVSKVTQATDVVQKRQFFQLAGGRPLRADIFEL